jgi:hypothetical protein
MLGGAPLKIKIEGSSSYAGRRTAETLKIKIEGSSSYAGRRTAEN